MGSGTRVAIYIENPELDAIVAELESTEPRFHFTEDAVILMLEQNHSPWLQICEVMVACFSAETAQAATECSVQLLITSELALRGEV